MEGYIIGGILVLLVVGIIFWRLRANIDPFWHKTALDRALILIKGTPIVTPDNIQMFYEKGVEKIPHAAVDSGVARSFARLACRYTTERGQYVVKVVVVQGEIAPEARIPCFRVPITAFSHYYNGEWDMMRGSREKVHYLLAAAQVIAVGIPYGDIMIFPSSTDAAFIENIADWEFEHIGLAHEDGDEFDRTKHHAPGTGHPIVGPCPGTSAVGFAARPDTHLHAVEWKDAEQIDRPRTLVTRKEPYQCVLLTK